MCTSSALVFKCTLSTLRFLSGKMIFCQSSYAGNQKNVHSYYCQNSNLHKCHSKFSLCLYWMSSLVCRNLVPKLAKVLLFLPWSSRHSFVCLPPFFEQSFAKQARLKNDPLLGNTADRQCPREQVEANTVHSSRVTLKDRVASAID